ncbi:PepSY domain-containing protein [Sphingomonas sp. LaA6.9]|uniref:PepSY domain-containing protein n=1 Tax=Sphingomonas sp. LaA6.9 TaxID=2919914 RepID=UPI001F4FC2BD|nr:hypothetical protein [Sphingomonas sp. LaA6.9]MCJ8155898.1 hypothetical protein [Sphingomonas sp. LaA6.9]
MLRLAKLSILGLLSACAPENVVPPENREAETPATTASDDVVTELSAAAIPAEIRELAEKTVEGIRISGAERKEREGRIYYDVEGARPDGSEVELDILRENGVFRVVEIQRDIAWADVPANAKAAAAKSPTPFVPVRVIESRETDGSIVFELFSKDRADKPTLEVRVVDGKAELLATAWPH